LRIRTVEDQPKHDAFNRSFNRLTPATLKTVNDIIVEAVNGCQNPRIDGGRGRSIHAWPPGGLPLMENRALS
jgi:hypothetical protein